MWNTIDPCIFERSTPQCDNFLLEYETRSYVRWLARFVELLCAYIFVDRAIHIYAFFSSLFPTIIRPKSSNQTMRTVFVDAFSFEISLNSLEFNEKTKYVWMIEEYLVGIFFCCCLESLRKQFKYLKMQIVWIITYGAFIPQKRWAAFTETEALCQTKKRNSNPDGLFFSSLFICRI